MDELQKTLEQMMNTMPLTSISTEKSKGCRLCEGTLWHTFNDENGYVVAKRCSCFKGEQSARRLRFADLPKAFAGMDLSNFYFDAYSSQQARQKIMAIKKAAETYLTKRKDMFKEGRGLYIYSNTKGSGKTRLAVSLANEFIRKNVKVKFATSTTIIQEIKRSWNRENGYTESGLLDDLTTVELLIIDDFGTEEVKPWINDRFYQIINQRYINKKPTILTSNESLKTLEYDDRITNRLKEISFVLHFPEESIRDYIAQDRNKELIEMIKN